MGRIRAKLQGATRCFASGTGAPIKRPVQAQAGEILISLHDNEDPMFGIDVVPFLAASYDEAHKLSLIHI